MFNFKYSFRSISFLLLILLCGLSFIVDTPAIAKISSKNKVKEEIPKSLLPNLVEKLGATNSKYHIYKNVNTYRAKTPGHSISTTFHKDRVSFERGSSTIGMKLVSDYKNINPSKVSDNKIEYMRGNVTEWYVNSPYGVEQGFTLKQKPHNSRSNVSINIDLRLSEGIKALDTEDGKSIVFVDNHNNNVLNYKGLYAFDSVGKELPSSLILKDHNTIQINVDDRDAMYPIIIDPFIESQRVTKSDPTSGSGDDFGFSVFIDGDRAILGIPGWDDTAGINQGAAVIYERNGSGNWIEVQTLTSPTPSAHNNYGYSVCLNGDWILVGEPDGDDGGTNDGSAHFYQLVGGTWNFIQTVNSAIDLDDEYGFAVSLSGNTAIIGDPEYGSSGNEFNSGAIFIYERTGSTWIPIGSNPVAASDSIRTGNFGNSVSISGDGSVAIVGAPGDNDGGLLDGVVWGAVYFFQKTGGIWTETQKVIGTPDSEFGYSVSMSEDGTIAVAGAFGEIGEEGVNTGAAYVFERNGTDWTIGSDSPDVTTTETRIGASDENAGDRFGISVAIFGDIIVAGAIGQDIGPSGQPGSISAAGSAYIYERIGFGNWGNEQEVFASDPTSIAEFGMSVSMSGNTILVGSPQADDVNANQGAGYFFDLAAKLTIEKESNPDGATGFGFAGTGFDPSCGLNGAFMLDDDDSAGTSFIECDVLPGTYTVQETDPNGHNKTDIDCVGTTDFTETADSVTVNLVSEDNVVCTFTNTMGFTLTTTVTGSGTVTGDGGVNCSDNCTNEFVTGTEVTLTANPTQGAQFITWSGDCSAAGSNTEAMVTMDSAKSCTAEFELVQNTLTVNIIGDGSGTVSSEPAGISCGVDCTENYDSGTLVTLTPTPTGDSFFSGFTGTGCTSGVVTMDEDRTCDATFSLKPTLTITKEGTGSGSVRSAPEGINCGATCSALFDTGTVVTLTPEPDEGSVFSGYTRDPDCNDGVVTLDNSITCTAIFNTVSVPTVTLQPLDPGQTGVPNTFTITGATPNGSVRILWSFNEGNTNADNICEGFVAGLTNPRNLTTISANETGTATFVQNLPNSIAGLTFKVQAVDLTSCEGSNVRTETIQSGVSSDNPILHALVPGQVGQNVLTASEHTPGGQVAIIWGFFEGNANGNSLCQGLTAGINNFRFLQNVQADQAGDVTLDVTVPPGGAGFTVKVQSIDLDTCTPSNVTTETF